MGVGQQILGDGVTASAGPGAGPRSHRAGATLVALRVYHNFEEEAKGCADATATLHTTISRLRKKLGDAASEQRYLFTEHGNGYRFVAFKEESQPAARPASPVAPGLTSSSNLPVQHTLLIGREDEVALVEQLAREAFSLCQLHDDHEGLAHTYHLLADIARAQQQFDLALSHYAKSIAIHGELRNPACIAKNIDGMAYVAALRGKVRESLALWLSAEQIRAAVKGVLRPVDEALYAPLIPQLCAQLDPGALQEIEAAVRQMILEEIIQHAIRSS